MFVPEGKYKLITEISAKSTRIFLPSKSMDLMPVPYVTFTGFFLHKMATPLYPFFCALNQY